MFERSVDSDLNGPVVGVGGVGERESTNAIGLEGTTDDADEPNTMVEGVICEMGTFR